MRKTLEEARAAAIADGMPEKLITPEVLRRYAWEPDPALVQHAPVPADTDQAVSDQVAATLEEMQANQAGENLLAIAGKGFGLLLKILG